MKFSNVNWKHLVAGVLVAVGAFLLGQNGGLAGMLITIGNSVADVVSSSQ